MTLQAPICHFSQLVNHPAFRSFPPTVSLKPSLPAQVPDSLPMKKLGQPSGMQSALCQRCEFLLRAVELVVLVRRVDILVGYRSDEWIVYSRDLTRLSDWWWERAWRGLRQSLWIGLCLNTNTITIRRIDIVITSPPFTTPSTADHYWETKFDLQTLCAPFKERLEKEDHDIVKVPSKSWPKWSCLHDWYVFELCCDSGPPTWGGKSEGGNSSQASQDERCLNTCVMAKR